MKKSKWLSLNVNAILLQYVWSKRIWVYVNTSLCKNIPAKTVTVRHKIVQQCWSKNGNGKTHVNVEQGKVIGANIWSALPTRLKHQSLEFVFLSSYLNTKVAKELGVFVFLLLLCFLHIWRNYKTACVSLLLVCFSHIWRQKVALNDICMKSHYADNAPTLIWILCTRVADEIELQYWARWHEHQPRWDYISDGCRHVRSVREYPTFIPISDSIFSFRNLSRA